MIIYSDKNIFEHTESVLVNPVNCVGVMGAGLALEFKKRFPDMYKNYLILCRKKVMMLGSPVLDDSDITKIILFPTKSHYSEQSNIVSICMGFSHLNRICFKEKIESIAMPLLGCGLGGLNENLVKEKIELFMGKSLTKVYVCEKK